MKKIVLFFSVTFFIHHFSFAQVSETRVQVDTSQRPALYFEIDMPESDVEDAINAYFDSLHIEKEKGKGFIIKKQLGYMLFKRAKADYMNDYLDFYFVTDTKKQKGQDATKIYLAASKSYGNFISADNEKSSWEDMKKFAAYLQSNWFQEFQVTVKINDINKELDKANEKLAELQKLIADKSTMLAGLQEQLAKIKDAKPK